MSFKYIFSIVLLLYILLLYINCVYRLFLKSVKKSPPPPAPHYAIQKPIFLQLTIQREFLKESATKSICNATLWLALFETHSFFGNTHILKRILFTFPRLKDLSFHYRSIFGWPFYIKFQVHQYF